jgi:hypothetical protein
VIDVVACEPQFVDHAAPVWRALPSGIRGRFLVDGSLMARAEAKGIDAVEIDATVLRLRTPPPKAEPGDGPMAFVVSIGDTKIARRLGYRRFVFMEHGAGQAYTAQPGINARNPSYAGGIDREDVGLFLVPNEYSRRAVARRVPRGQRRGRRLPEARRPPGAEPRRPRARGRDLVPLAGLRRTRGRQRAGHLPPGRSATSPSATRSSGTPTRRATGPSGWSTLPGGRDRVRARLRRGLPAGRRLRLRQQLDAVRVRVDRTAGRRHERRLMAPERPPRPALLGRRARRGQRRPRGPPRRRGRAGARGPRRAARGPLGRAGHRLPYRTGAAERAAAAIGAWAREAVAA